MRKGDFFFVNFLLPRMFICALGNRYHIKVSMNYHILALQTKRSGTKPANYFCCHSIICRFNCSLHLEKTYHFLLVRARWKRNRKDFAVVWFLNKAGKPKASQKMRTALLFERNIAFQLNIYINCFAYSKKDLRSTYFLCKGKWKTVTRQ